jgi:hypothetical protein
MTIDILNPEITKKMTEDIQILSQKVNEMQRNLKIKERENEYEV